MTERPTDYVSLVAALGLMADDYRKAAQFNHQSDAYRDLLTRTADRLAALLPPAKERVPWHEAKGRTVDGVEVVGLHWWPGEGQAGVEVQAFPTRRGLRVIPADPDGMVEVDAL